MKFDIFNPVSSAIKSGAAEIEHLLSDEIAAAEKSEAVLLPILQKIDPNAVAALAVQLSGGKITTAEALAAEQEFTTLAGVAGSVMAKLKAKAAS